MKPIDWGEISKELDDVTAMVASSLKGCTIEPKYTNNKSEYDRWTQKEIYKAINMANGYIKEEKKENKNMTTSITNYSMRKYEDIKDDLQVTSMTIEQSTYSSPKVKFEDYIPLVTTTYKNRTNNEPKIPTCKGIIRRKNTTRVDWADGTKTVIVLEDGREDMDMFHTFCIAFTKKMLGSTTSILKVIEECDTDTVERKRKEAIEKAIRKAEEETRKLKEKMDKAAFERAVQEKMFEEEVIEEALRRLCLREERRLNREDPVESFQIIEIEEEKTDET